MEKRALERLNPHTGLPHNKTPRELEEQRKAEAAEIVASLRSDVVPKRPATKLARGVFCTALRGCLRDALEQAPDLLKRKRDRENTT